MAAASFIFILLCGSTPYNHRKNVLSVSLNKNISFLLLEYWEVCYIHRTNLWGGVALDPPPPLDPPLVFPNLPCLDCANKYRIPLLPTFVVFYFAIGVTWIMQIYLVRDDRVHVTNAHASTSAHSRAFSSILKLSRNE